MYIQELAIPVIQMTSDSVELPGMLRKIADQMVP